MIAAKELKQNAQLVEQAIEDRPFRLGMPHMSATGVSRSWLLREATHRHWALIASQVGVNPSDLCDETGARVLASVVACTLNGDADAFNEDDTCEFMTTEYPSVSNGWRSQLDLISAGKSIRVEILTSFAKRNGASNTRLAPAELGAEFLASWEQEDARRTKLIRMLGSRDRARAAQDTAPPHMTFEICPEGHLNGVGLVYFASIHDMVARSERNAIPDLVHAYPMRNRRVHYFGNLDAGDALDLTSSASVQAFSPNASVVVQTHGRRRSDGSVIVCAESIYGP